MMATIQQIYDFCLLDRTYREYYNIPDQFKCTRPESHYYYGNVRSGQCRAGTFIYSQAIVQLKRFLKGIREDYYFHVSTEDYKEVDYQKYDGRTIYIVSHIREKGVRIEFTHPFNGKSYHFIARSHRPYSQEGLTAEVKNYFEKHLLFPAGRFCELQLQYKITKEDFPRWYRRHKEEVEIAQGQEHWKMVEKYSPTCQMSYQESYNTLAASGAFFDFNCDEFERNEMAEQFMGLCNASQ